MALGVPSQPSCVSPLPTGPACAHPHPLPHSASPTHPLPGLNACCLELTLLLQRRQPPRLLHLELTCLALGLLTPAPTPHPQQPASKHTGIGCDVTYDAAPPQPANTLTCEAHSLAHTTHWQDCKAGGSSGSGGPASLIPQHTMPHSVPPAPQPPPCHKPMSH